MADPYYINCAPNGQRMLDQHRENALSFIYSVDFSLLTCSFNFSNQSSLASTINIWESSTQSRLVVICWESQKL